MAEDLRRTRPRVRWEGTACGSFIGGCRQRTQTFAAAAESGRGRGRWRGFGRTCRHIEGGAVFGEALLRGRGARAAPGRFCSSPRAGHVSSPRSQLGVTIAGAIANRLPCQRQQHMCTHNTDTFTQAYVKAAHVLRVEPEKAMEPAPPEWSIKAVWLGLSGPVVASLYPTLVGCAAAILPVCRATPDQDPTPSLHGFAPTGVHTVLSRPALQPLYKSVSNSHATHNPCS